MTYALQLASGPETPETPETAVLQSQIREAQTGNANGNTGNTSTTVKWPAFPASARFSTRRTVGSGGAAGPLARVHTRGVTRTSPRARPPREQRRPHTPAAPVVPRSSDTSNSGGRP